MNRSLVFSASLLLALVLPACTGPGFQRAWKAAASSPSDGVSGRWEGTWRSEVNGHQGRLRCVVTPPAEAGGTHQFHYHATWMGFLSAAYRTQHKVETNGPQRWTFHGEHTLPAWAGGRYRYDGRIEGNRFQADYQCELDRGSYHLERPKK